MVDTPLLRSLKGKIISPHLFYTARASRCEDKETLILEESRIVIVDTGITNAKPKRGRTISEPQYLNCYRPAVNRYHDV